MPFSLERIPTILDCPRCGLYIKDISQSDGFEAFVAAELQAKNAEHWREGFDVYDSPLYPGLTFQVKYAQGRERPAETKIVGGRLSTWAKGHSWTWHEPKAGGSDFYILFGIRGDLVYPFVAPVAYWLDESYDTGKGGRIMTISCDEYSHCGRYANSYKRNKFWQYSVPAWPADLHDRIHYYTKRQPSQQMQLFERQVAYVA